MSVNKVILVGNVGRDPEVKHLDSGVKLARFPLATNETYIDKNTNQKVQQTEWHNITVWRGPAETVEKYVKTGSLLYVEGRIRTYSYDDKETGAKKYFTEIVCQNFRFLGPPPGSEGSSASYQSKEKAPAEASTFNEPDVQMPEPEDDLPF